MPPFFFCEQQIQWHLLSLKMNLLSSSVNNVFFIGDITHFHKPSSSCSISSYLDLWALFLPWPLNAQCLKGLRLPTACVSQLSCPSNKCSSNNLPVIPPFQIHQIAPWNTNYVIIEGIRNKKTNKSTKISLAQGNKSISLQFCILLDFYHFMFKLLGKFKVLQFPKCNFCFSYFIHCCDKMPKKQDSGLQLKSTVCYCDRSTVQLGTFRPQYGSREMNKGVSSLASFYPSFM